MYNQVTGDNASPIAIGGGTYARALKCGCAFGPEMAGDEATIHQANEYVTFAQIEQMSEIYYNAIKAVCAKNANFQEESTQDKTPIAAPQNKTRVAVAVRKYSEAKTQTNAEDKKIKIGKIAAKNK